MTNLKSKCIKKTSKEQSWLLTSMSNSLRSDFFSISSPCSFKKVHRNKLRFCMKFCSSLLPCLYASFIFVLTGSIARNWCIVRVNSWTNCSSYCVTWTPAEINHTTVIQNCIRRFSKIDFHDYRRCHCCLCGTANLWSFISRIRITFWKPQTFEMVPKY